MPTADAIRQHAAELHSRLEDVERFAAETFANIDHCQCSSPHERYRSRQKAKIFAVLTRLTSSLLSQISDYPTEIRPVSVLLLMEAIIERALQEINAFEASEGLEWTRDSATGFGTMRPWTSCQISHNESQSSRYFHEGTGNMSYGGGYSSTSVCGGPLRTDEEKELGICGSCIRHHRRLGVDYSVEEVNANC